MTFSVGQPEQTGLDVILQGLGGGVAQGLQQSLEQFHKTKQLEQTESVFKQQGYPEDLAKLAAAATTGGQTEVLKQLLEMRQRGLLQQPGAAGGPEGAPEGIAEDVPDAIEEVPEEIDFQEEIGLTPKEKVTRRERQEQRSFERNKKFLDRMSSIAEELPKERLALSQMEGAIDDKDFNSWRNAVAEMTNLDVLKTASAQTVNSAIKQFLMSSLAAITGRPNQFIERQITKALISPLYKTEANRLIFDGLKGLSRLKEREVEIAENLEEKYTEKGREIPRNFQKLVREKLKKETLAFEKEYEDKVRDLLSSKKDMVPMRDPQGNLRSVPKSDVKAAQKAGYKIGK